MNTQREEIEAHVRQDAANMAQRISERFVDIRHVRLDVKYAQRKEPDRDENGVCYHVEKVTMTVAWERTWIETEDGAILLSW